MSVENKLSKRGRERKQENIVNVQRSDSHPPLPPSPSQSSNLGNTLQPQQPQDKEGPSMSRNGNSAALHDTKIIQKRERLDLRASGYKWQRVNMVLARKRSFRAHAWPLKQVAGVVSV